MNSRDEKNEEQLPLTTLREGLLHMLGLPLDALPNLSDEALLKYVQEWLNDRNRKN